MYDRQTESWWQHFGGEALVGTLAGKKLRQLPARIVSWRDFRRAHPSGLVLNRDTGHVRDDATNPYAGYDDIDTTTVEPGCLHSLLGSTCARQSTDSRHHAASCPRM